MRFISCLIVLSIAGCTQLPDFLAPADAPEARATTVPAETPEAAAESGDAVDALAPAPSNETLATLGNAAEPGLWLKTPLVSSQRPGRISSVENGRTVEVTLIPLEAAPTAGSRASLAALQALGLPLTAISPLIVEPI